MSKYNIFLITFDTNPEGELIFTIDGDQIIKDKTLVETFNDAPDPVTGEVPGTIGGRLMSLQYLNPANTYSYEDVGE